MKPLSEISKELRAIRGLICGEFSNAGSQMEQLADAIDQHARESVNQRLIEAAKDLLGAHVWGNRNWSKDGHLGLCSIRGEKPEECAVCGHTVRMMQAIAAAESAQPVERKVGEGWCIIHPDGKPELQYFDTVEWKTKLDGYKDPVTPEFWMKTYRPNCKLIRVTITEQPLEVGK